MLMSVAEKVEHIQTTRGLLHVAIPTILSLFIIAVFALGFAVWL